MFSDEFDEKQKVSNDFGWKLTNFKCQKLQKPNIGKILFKLFSFEAIVWDQWFPIWNSQKPIDLTFSPTPTIQLKPEHWTLDENLNKILSTRELRRDVGKWKMIYCRFLQCLKFYDGSRLKSWLRRVISQLKETPSVMTNQLTCSNPWIY